MMALDLVTETVIRAGTPSGNSFVSSPRLHDLRLPKNSPICFYLHYIVNHLSGYSSVFAMRKFANGTIQSFCKSYLYSMAGLLTAVFAPVGMVFFGMAALRGMGSYGKYIAYIAVGAAIGFVISFVNSLSGMITGFLPGILGQAAGWLILGGVITFLVYIIMKAFGAYASRGK